jgi:hypothetical protein
LSVGLIAMVALSGSASDAAGEEATAEAIRSVPAPAGSAFLDALWVGPNSVLVTQLVQPKLRGRLAIVNVTNGAFRALTTARRPGCDATGAQFPTRHGPGAVAYLSTCFGGPGTPDRINQIRRYRLADGVNRPLFPYYVNPFVGRFTFSPNGSRGLVNDGYGLGERLRWLKQRSMPAVRLTGIVRAGMPSWSPSGEQVVFDAVPVGEKGDIAVAPRTLFVASASKLGKARALVTGITETIGSGASWIPGRPWVVYSMRPPHSKAGLWLVDVRTGKRLLLRAGVGFGRSDITADGTIALPTGVDSAQPYNANAHGSLLLLHLRLAQLDATLARQP